MKLIIIGSSTGGPRVLFDLFDNLPVMRAVIIIVQHMPASTTGRMAKRLSQLTSNEVVIPDNGTRIKPGNIYIAPGDLHLILNNYEVIQLTDTEKVNFVRPSIDVTMLALKPDLKYELVGVVLTGMGFDGAEGLAHMKDIGGITIVQDPATCTIKSMPEAALKTEKVDFVMIPENIRKYLIDFGQS
jgi:two-component system chemotaxis response regulator CheB